MLSVARDVQTPVMWIGSVALTCGTALLPSRALPIVYFLSLLLAGSASSYTTPLWLLPLTATSRLNGRLGWTGAVGAMYAVSPNPSIWPPNWVQSMILIGIATIELYVHLSTKRRSRQTA
jgi:hypothetical protein